MHLAAWCTFRIHSFGGDSGGHMPAAERAEQQVSVTGELVQGLGAPRIVYCPLADGGMLWCVSLRLDRCTLFRIEGLLAGVQQTNGL
jgi:hypothetical protein